MNGWQTIITAVVGITTNWLRAALTTLGIIIGVASVISMLALGNGARAAVEANFRSLGSDVIQVTVKEIVEEGAVVPVGKILSYREGLDIARELPLVRRVIMSITGAGKLRYGRKLVDLPVVGVTADALLTVAARAEVQPVRWPAERPLAPTDLIGRGRFFTPAEVAGGADVCVLGQKTALDLFEGDDPLDEAIWINRRKCLVIGVLTELEVTNPQLRARSRPNEAFYLPISTAIANLYEEEPSVAMAVQVIDETMIDEARAQIATFLRTRHGIEADRDGEYPDDFQMVSRKDILGAQQAAARTFAFLLAAMALVSLLVGGIGIMNVMLVSVTERTREIGVRMALGAAPADIVRQFLLEAVLLSGAGGMLGLAAGILSIPLVASLNQGVALLDPASLPLAFGVALLTGVVFGLYPAVRAARLDPIEALRFE